MPKQSARSSSRVLLALVAACGLSTSALAQPTPLSSAFTYQGTLANAGVPVDGTVDLQFSLFDSASGGTQLGVTQFVGAVTVTAGRFTARVNENAEFGGLPFGGTRRWLEIGVRSPAGSGGPYQILTPRIDLTLTPIASFAINAGSLANLGAGYFLNASNLSTGTLSLSRLPTTVARTDTPQTFTGLLTANGGLSSTGTISAAQFSGSGAALTGLDATNLATGTLSDSRLSTNVALKNAANAFSGINTFSSASNAFTGSGAGLTGLNASNLALGTVAEARLPASLALEGDNNAFTGANTFSNPANSFTGSGAGLTALNASNFSSGTLAAARLPSTVARTDIANAFGNFTNTFAGSVGIGTASPLGNLHVADSGDAIAVFGPGTAASTQLIVGTSAAGNGYPYLQGVKASGSLWGDLILNPTAGRVGVGYSTPAARLHVRGEDHHTSVFDSVSPLGSWLNLSNASPGGRIWSVISTAAGNSGGAGNLQFGVGTSLGAVDLAPVTFTRTGMVGIGTSAPATQLHVVGTTRTSILEITGGSDIAEPYGVTATNGVHAAPGMVVSIDPDHVGKLRVSTGAYDTAVAGIISGANGVNVGLTLRQQGSAIADGEFPVANVGRVWCYVDADLGPIMPGDLLTTSNTPGHAMKADPAKANGAILGKAMSRLESGKGMVLVLVGLQ